MPRPSVRSGIIGQWLSRSPKSRRERSGAHAVQPACRSAEADRTRAGTSPSDRTLGGEPSPRGCRALRPERPLTHDLFAATLAELGIKLRRVVVPSLSEETFHATLELEPGRRTYAIDADHPTLSPWPSRTGVRIFASIEVLDRAGVEPDNQVDEKLEVFREFVNSLDVDLEEDFREGPARTSPLGLTLTPRARKSRSPARRLRS